MNERVDLMNDAFRYNSMFEKYRYCLLLAVEKSSNPFRVITWEARLAMLGEGGDSCRRAMAALDGRLLRPPVVVLLH
ncbi:hypothetical protein TNIN_103231 [Trichonephila inaurata madagascariensis]|uniref:Uncharacterized protein n=1 Tax=Trichonephila inaurata madagascariensis TaxID=2747483 RepID=A0A8X6IC63_9ARAC|nr:hypothetical protein TNIN_103231 [Trichonephila inaurata madagascariensis]